MTKKKVTIEIKCCDILGCEAEAYSMCQGCGADFCSEHKKSELVRYPYDFIFRTTLDGEYCLDCDRKFKAEGNPLHKAFIKSKQLEIEWESFKEDANRRREAIKSEIDVLRQEREAEA